MVINPAGRETLLVHDERDSRTDFAFGGTDQVGVYQVKWDDGVTRSFAVNLLDKDESNIEPRSTVQIGADKVIAGMDRSQPREIWKWFALLALAALLLEWYIYNRRIYI